MKNFIFHFLFLLFCFASNMREKNVLCNIKLAIIYEFILNAIMSSRTYAGDLNTPCILRNDKQLYNYLNYI